MPNQYVNKVVTSNGITLIDLTGDTVTSASDIVAGKIGHLADGSQVTGTASSGGGSVTITDETNATGTTCVITTSAGPEPAITWETIFNGQARLVGNDEDIYFWISSLSNVYPVAGERWRITFQGSEYISTAIFDSAVGGVCVGNPAYSGYGGQDDGSGCPVCFFNMGWGAWTGEAAPSYGVGTYSLKLEREVSE